MNYKTKKIILLVVLLLAAGCGQNRITTSNTSTSNYSHNLQIGNKTLRVEIANTDVQKKQGLSGRTSMQDNEGVLFDFSDSSNTLPSFWMKDMNFNLDIIWIKNKKIIGITADVPRPPSPAASAVGGQAVPVNCESSIVNCNLPLYSPPLPVDSVLEVNAGWNKKNNIKIGDEIKIIN